MTRSLVFAEQWPGTSLESGKQPTELKLCPLRRSLNVRLLRCYLIVTSFWKDLSGHSFVYCRFAFVLSLLFSCASTFLFVYRCLNFTVALRQLCWMLKGESRDHITRPRPELPVCCPIMTDPREHVEHISWSVSTRLTPWNAHRSIPSGLHFVWTIDFRFRVYAFELTFDVLELRR